MVINDGLSAVPNEGGDGEEILQEARNIEDILCLLCLSLCAQLGLLLTKHALCADAAGLVGHADDGGDGLVG